MTDAIRDRAAMLEQALELHAQGLGYRRIARAMGVSATTVRRFVKPGYADHMRRMSREAKDRRKRFCVRGCGNTTAWDSTSGVCQECSAAEREPEHGVYTRYNSRKWACRCSDCRAAWASHVRDYYYRRKAS